MSSPTSASARTARLPPLAPRRAASGRGAPAAAAAGAARPASTAARAQKRARADAGQARWPPERQRVL